jgi:O-antigen/teichoic acid export membrane protein
VALALRLLLAVSLPMAAGGLLVGRDLLVFLVGEAYLPGLLAFLVLMPLLPVRFVNNLLANALSALNLQEARTRGTGYAAAINLAANLAMVPFFGAFGAALTTLLTDVCLLVYQGIRIREVVHGVAVVSIVARLVAPLVVMVAVVAFMDGVHVVPRVAVGGVVYALLVVATGGVRLQDLRALRKV